MVNPGMGLGGLGRSQPGDGQRDHRGQDRPSIGTGDALQTGAESVQSRVRSRGSGENLVRGLDRAVVVIELEDVERLRSRRMHVVIVVDLPLSGNVDQYPDETCIA